MLACDCGSRTFFIMNFLNFFRWKSNSWKTTVWGSNDSNKIGMGVAVSQDLFYFGFFVAAAEDFVTCWHYTKHDTLRSFPWDALVYGSIMAFYLNLEKLGKPERCVMLWASMSRWPVWVGLMCLWLTQATVSPQSTSPFCFLPIPYPFRHLLRKPNL